MLFDHVAVTFFPDQWWMNGIGRLTMPIFAYAIARGFYYTHNRKKYLLQLAILAIISQIPFMLLFDRGWTLNMVFPWALAVLALMGSWWLPIAFAAAFILIPMDYTSVVILLPTVIYYFWFKDKKPLQLLLYSVAILSLISIWSASPVQWFALLAIPLIYFVEPYDNKIKVNKWFFYAFYPAHMLLFWGIQELILTG